MKIPTLRPWLRENMEDFRRARLPLVVWIVAASMAAAMLTGRARGREYVGLASAMRYTVSAPVAGRVEEVLVRELDEVQKGQMVARLEDEMLQARIQTATASARQLSAELDAERARLTAGEGPLAEAYSSDLRRFRMDEQGRRLSVLSLRVEVDNDAIEQERLRLDADRSEHLFARGILSEAERDLARLAVKQVSARLERNKELLATTEQETLEATRRREEFERAHPSATQIQPALAPLEEAIRVQQGVLEELRAEQGNLVLRSPVSGSVTQVLCRTGQAVDPAAPILIVSEKSAAEILAYLPEWAAGRVHEKAVVEVTRRSDPSRVVESVVTRVGATFELKPQQLWRDPRVPEHGLPIAIAAVAALELTPGEVVFVRTK